jgi:hypothetical protein
MDMKEPMVSRILKFSLYVALAADAAAVATLPILMDAYMAAFEDGYKLLPEYRAFITVFLLSMGALAFWILLEMIMMLRSIGKPEGPFVRRNVSALNRVGIGAFALTALFLFKCFCYNTFLTMAAVVLFVLCGLFAFTLANLFRQAVVYKEENDLTI